MTIAYLHPVGIPPASSTWRVPSRCCTDDRELVSVLRGRVAAAAKLERFSDARAARVQLHEALGKLSDVERVEEAIGLFYKALSDASLDNMVARWADDPSVSCVSPFARIAVGTEDVEMQWTRIFTYGDSFLVDFNFLNVCVRDSCAWALVEQTVQSVRGKEVIGGKCVATNILRQSGPEWLLLHHHAAPVVDEREEQIMGEEVQ